jgi:hypothetical protein
MKGSPVALSAGWRGTLQNGRVADHSGITRGQSGSPLQLGRCTRPDLQIMQNSNFSCGKIAVERSTTHMSMTSEEYSVRRLGKKTYSIWKRLIGCLRLQGEHGRIIPGEQTST